MPIKAIIPYTLAGLLLLFHQGLTVLADDVIMADFSKGSDQFYKEALDLLIRNKIPFMIGGGWAAKYHGPSIPRAMKDIDIFCKAGDAPKTISLFQENGYKVDLRDARWLAQITKDKGMIDLVFSSPNYIMPVDESWFLNATVVKLFDTKVKVISAEESIWCKVYVRERNKYDGADINHIILSQGKTLDWKRLLSRMESDWELLFEVILNFRFVYPSERGIIPKWLIEELISRLQNQLNNPIPKDKVCRGYLLSRSEYFTDIREGGFTIE